MTSIRKMLSVLLSVLLMMCGCAVYAGDTPVTCKAEDCDVGEPTFITCNFHKNINGSKPGVNVVRYPVSPSNTNQEKDVLRCIWPDDADAPECIVEEGFKFNYLISDRLTLEIPAATDQVAGLYFCHVIPQGDFYFNGCELIVGGLSTTPASSEVYKDLTTPLNDGRGPYTQSDKCDELTPVMIASASLVITVVLVATLVLSRRQGQTSPSERRTSGDGTEEGDQNSPRTHLLCNPRMHQGSDLHDSTMCRYVQTDFDSGQPVAKDLSDTPPISKDNRVQLPNGLRRKGTWELALTTETSALRERQAHHANK